MSNPSLSIVIPTYNERENISKILTSLKKTLKGINHEIIFVDDNSPDGTSDEIRSFIENTSRIKLRNKLSKRLLPIKIIEGKLNIEDNILNNEKIIGKILINDKYPFGLVKIKEYKIDYLNSYKTKNALIKFIKPFWEN